MLHYVYAYTLPSHTMCMFRYVMTTQATDMSEYSIIIMHYVQINGYNYISIVLDKILEMKHVIDDQELTLKPLPPGTDSLFTELPPLISDSETVVVRGFQEEIHEDMLDLYFTHEAMSGGGPIDKIVIKEKEAFIVFTDRTSM